MSTPPITPAPIDPASPALPISDGTLQRIRQLLRPDYKTFLKAAPLVTKLPTIAGDGDTVDYYARAVDTGALTDVLWKLQYDAKTKYWYPVGAPAAMIQYVSAGIASSLANTWQDTVTPKLTVPFAGDYDADYSSLCSQSTTAGVNTALGIITNGIGSPGLYAQQAVSPGLLSTLSGPVPLIGLTASAVLSLSVFTTDLTPSRTVWPQRIIRATPIRVR